MQDLLMPTASKRQSALEDGSALSVLPRSGSSEKLPRIPRSVEALQKLFIIGDIDAWCPAIRSRTALRSSPKGNLADPSIAVSALGISPEYFVNDYKTPSFLIELLIIATVAGL